MTKPQTTKPPNAQTTKRPNKKSNDGKKEDTHTGFMKKMLSYTAVMSAIIGTGMLASCSSKDNQSTHGLRAVEYIYLTCGTWI